jgi:hypothetical protein
MSRCVCRPFHRKPFIEIRDKPPVKSLALPGIAQVELSAQAKFKQRFREKRAEDSNLPSATANQDLPRRNLRRRGLQNGFCHLHGIVAVFNAKSHFLDDATSLLLVDTVNERSGGRIAIELRANKSRLDQDRTNTKTADFEVQSLCPTGQRVLGGGIHRLEWHRQKASHRADVHDPASSLPAHHGQDRLRHSYHAEEICFEHVFDLRETQFLDGAGDGNPGTIHPILMPEGVVALSPIFIGG